MRLGSGSILVASVAHGLWNGLAYVLFGYGADAGILGITDFDLYGPERGVLGMMVNAAALALLFVWLKRRENMQIAVNSSIS